MAKKSILTIIRPLTAGAAVTAAALLLLALLMLKLEWDGETLENAVLAVYALAGFAAGYCAGKGAGRKRFLWGLGAGNIYFVILWFLSLAGGRQFEADALGMCLIYSLCGGGGMAGGMLSGLGENQS